MMNTYDIRKDNNLVYVIPTGGLIGVNGSRMDCNIAIVVHLYYVDTLDFYIPYLTNIPDWIKLYIFSPKKEILDYTGRKLKGRKNTKFYEKDNRGRDVSTLVVAAKDIVLQSDFVCFIHDKSPNYMYLQKDVYEWTKGLWDNTVFSEIYIDRVLQILGDNREIGLLVPPEPHGQYVDIWTKGTWYKDYENTVALANRLKLSADINRAKPIIGCGTMFWGRTVALAKLFEYKWQYDDFPEEPMGFAGTLGHAIERILPFVAQDAGYATGTIMTDQYISGAYSVYQEYAQTMFELLREKEGLEDMHQVMTYHKRVEKILDFLDKYDHCYIFGAGVYGRRLLKTILDNGRWVDGFVVSDNKRTDEEIDGLKVYEISEITFNNEIGVVIGLHYKYKDEAEELLKSRKVPNWMYAY